MGLPARQDPREIEASCDPTKFSLFFFSFFLERRGIALPHFHWKSTRLGWGSRWKKCFFHELSQMLTAYTLKVCGLGGSSAAR